MKQSGLYFRKITVAGVERGLEGRYLEKRWLCWVEALRPSRRVIPEGRQPGRRHQGKATRVPAVLCVVCVHVVLIVCMHVCVSTRVCVYVHV